jgi:hypothetical protein
MPRVCLPCSLPPCVFTSDRDSAVHLPQECHKFACPQVYPRACLPLMGTVQFTSSRYSTSLPQHERAASLPPPTLSGVVYLQCMHVKSSLHGDMQVYLMASPTMTRAVDYLDRSTLCVVYLQVCTRGSQLADNRVYSVNKPNRCSAKASDSP